MARTWPKMWRFLAGVVSSWAAGVLASPASAQSVTDFQSRSYRISATKSLPYRLFIPKGYQPGRKYPVMLTLHGAGERGSDNIAQLAHDFNKRWAADSVQTPYPHFVVAPQCSVNNQWVDVPWSAGSYDQSKKTISDELLAAVGILDSLFREFSLDPDRQYVSGLSMGGFGTWDLITRYPGRFAAAVPVCGGGDPRRAAAIAKLPIWTFHAADDNVVPVSGTREMVAALKAAGGSPKYDEYPANLAIGHASWTPAGRTPGLTAWVFAQSRQTTGLGGAAAHPAEAGPAADRKAHDGAMWFSPGVPGTGLVDGLGRIQGAP